MNEKNRTYYFSGGWIWTVEAMSFQEAVEAFKNSYIEDFDMNTDMICVDVEVEDNE